MRSKGQDPCQLSSLMLYKKLMKRGEQKYLRHKRGRQKTKRKG